MSIFIILHFNSLLLPQRQSLQLVLFYSAFIFFFFSFIFSLLEYVLINNKWYFWVLYINGIILYEFLSSLFTFILWISFYFGIILHLQKSWEDSAESTASHHPSLPVITSQCSVPSHSTRQGRHQTDSMLSMNTSLPSAATNSSFIFHLILYFPLRSFLHGSFTFLDIFLLW